MARLLRSQPIAPKNGQDATRRIIYAGGVVVTVALTGVGGVGTVGTLLPQTNVNVTGNSAVGSTGTLLPQTAVVGVGNSGVGAVGTLTPTSSLVIGLTGVSGVGSVGTLLPSTSVPLLGNSGVGATGTLTPTIGTTLALTGVSGVGAVGTLLPATSVPLTGNSAVGALGTFGVVGGSITNPNRSFYLEIDEDAGLSVLIGLPKLAYWNTGGRPASPANYTVGYNTTLLQEETWNGSAWVSAVVGGLDTNVQYNDGGVLAGDANFTWDKTNKKFYVNSPGPHGFGHTDANTSLALGGTFSGVVYTYGLALYQTLTPPIGNSAYGFGNYTNISKAGSGTHAEFIGNDFSAFAMGGGGATVTTAATVRVAGAPAGASSNYALWITSANTGDKSRIETLVEGTKNQYILPSTLTSSGGIAAIDASLSNNFEITLTENTKLANPTNLKSGMQLFFHIKQNGSSAKLLTFDTKYKFSSLDTHVMSTGLNTICIMSCYYYSADDRLECVFNGGTGFA